MVPCQWHGATPSVPRVPAAVVVLGALAVLAVLVPHDEGFGIDLGDAEVARLEEVAVEMTSHTSILSLYQRCWSPG